MILCVNKSFIKSVEGSNLKDLYNIIESGKHIEMFSSGSNKLPPEKTRVLFTLSVRTMKSNRIVIDSNTGLNYSVVTPKKYIAKTLWENCSLVAMEFVDNFVLPNTKLTVEDFFSKTALQRKGAYIDPKTQDIFILCNLIIADELENLFTCEFKDISDYHSGNTKLQEIINTYSLIKVNS